MDALIIEKYNDFLGRYTSGKTNIGRLENANAFADAPGCRGGRDHVFWYLLLENGIIKEVKFLCNQCDPPMMIVSDVLADLIKGLLTDKALEIDKGVISQTLKSNNKELIEHFYKSMSVLKNALTGKK